MNSIKLCRENGIRIMLSIVITTLKLDGEEEFIVYFAAEGKKKE